MEDVSNKLREKQAYYDNLAKETMHIQEKLRIEKENFKEDTEIVEKQDAELAKLKEWNTTEAKDVKELEEKIAEQRKIKVEEE